MATPNLTGITSVLPFVVSSQMSSGANAVYTVGASKAAKLATLALCNQGTSVVTVSVAIIPSGGTADGTHTLISSVPVEVGDTLLADEVAGMWLAAGAVVSVNASAASSVDAVLTGLEFS